MTTGCTCATPGCPGVAPERNTQCRSCQTGPVTPGPVRAVGELLHDVLFGRGSEPGIVFGPCDRSAETGIVRYQAAGTQAGS
jgi:hypothetical protein